VRLRARRRNKTQQHINIAVSMAWQHISKYHMIAIMATSAGGWHISLLSLPVVGMVMRMVERW